MSRQQEIQGLAARRAALRLLDAVLRRGETLDQAAGGATASRAAPISSTGRSARRGASSPSRPAAPIASISSTSATPLVPRSGNVKQWAYKDKPVYTFARDKAGEKGTGESIPNWKLLK